MRKLVVCWDYSPVPSALPNLNSLCRTSPGPKLPNEDTRPLPRQHTFINLLLLFYFSTNCFIFAQALDEQGSRRLTECGLGSGNVVPTGQLQDASSVRIRDASNNSPTFDSEGVVSGRIEVKPSGETAWGTIFLNWWDDVDALVACREIGNELDYATISGTALSYVNTPDGSGEIWWMSVECSGSEETLESCSKRTTTWTNHGYDIGITCKFVQADECEACPAGKFSDTIDIMSACTSCEAGRYSSSPSATSADTCLACEAGKAAGAGATICSTCASTNEDRTACTSCHLGSGRIRFQDAPSSVRIRDASNNSPTFDSEGVVSGRIEVKPLRETAWGTIMYHGWEDVDALVACREIGNELGYNTISGTKLNSSDTPDGSGEIWWQDVDCSGSEETLESCPKSTTTS